MGGIADDEFWSKLSLSGMHLHVTPGTLKVLGYTAEEMLGLSLFQLVPDPKQCADLQTAIDRCHSGIPITTRYSVRTPKGRVEVSTNFHPTKSPREPLSPIQASSDDGRPLSSEREPRTIFAQTSLVESLAQRKLVAPTPEHRESMSRTPSLGGVNGTSFVPSPYDRSSVGTGGSTSAGDTSSGSGSDSSRQPSIAFSTFTSTYKALPHPSSVSDNIFDEIDTCRGTSWQFELHQLRLTNKKLQEERQMLLNLRKKRAREIAAARAAPSVTSPAATTPNGQRACANCGRTNSPEWRAGPTGAKSLCNACGLRWSKARSQAQNAMGNKGQQGGTPTGENQRPRPTPMPSSASKASFRRPSMDHNASSFGLGSPQG